jgi:hypothetical protein
MILILKIDMNKLLLIFFITTLNVFAQNTSNNLLLHYEFNGNANDTSPNGFHGLESGVVYVSDRNGNPNSAVYFDGVDDFISLPNLNALKPDLPLSFSFWIKYDSLLYTDRAVFNTSFEEDVDSGVYFNSQATTGNIAINFGDGGLSYTAGSRRTFVSYQPIQNNVWYHIIVTVKSAQDMKIYVDCVETTGGYSGMGGQLQYSNKPGVIGKHDRTLNSPADHFKGTLDDFMYWDKELTPADFNQLCDGKLSSSEFEQTYGKIKMYPNPTGSKLNLNNNEGYDSILILNSIGQIVYKNIYQKIITLDNLDSGIYVIKLIGKKGSLTDKLIIQ